MRNAATFDDDLVDYGSAPRKGAPRKRRSTAAAGKSKKGVKRPRFDMHRVARFAAIGMAATMAFGIMINALVLQKGHHPSPLFGKTTTASTAPARAPAPLPPVRAAQIDTHPDEAVETAVKAPKNVIAVRGADQTASGDPIGRLLAGGSASNAKAVAKGDGKLEAKTVLGVQRALNKLGFKVPTTGAAGPVTKKAILAFEKDRHLAAKGEVDRHLMKVLATESGVKID